MIANSIWGRVVWYRNTGSREKPRLQAAQPVRVAWQGSPQKPAWNWWEPGPGELATQWRTTPYVVDLTGDGLNDLVMLDHQGYLALYERARRGDELVLMPPRRVFHDEEGKPLRLNDRAAGKSGRRKFCLVDWDGDGRVDLLANSRSVEFWRNVGDPQHPWRFKNEGDVSDHRLAGHTTSPTVVDFDRNGQPDLLIGAEDGFLYYLKR